MQRMRELQLFSLEKRRIKGLRNINKYLMGGNKEDGARLFSASTYWQDKRQWAQIKTHMRYWLNSTGVTNPGVSHGFCKMEIFSFAHPKIQYMLNSFDIPHYFTLLFMLALIGYSLLFLHPYIWYCWGILSGGHSLLLSDSLLMAFACLS